MNPPTRLPVPVRREVFRELQPGAAKEYLRETAREFERHFQEGYRRILTTPQAPETALYGAIRYAHTRGLSGHDAEFREILTSGSFGAGARDIYQAARDALVSTTTDRTQTADFFVYLATARPAFPSSRFCLPALRELQPESVCVLLGELGKEPDGLMRRRLARLLSQVAGVKLAQRLAFWDEAPASDRQAALATLRQEIGAGVPNACLP